MNWVMATSVLVGYVVISIGGLTLIKSADSGFTPAGILGYALYGGGFLVWIFVILRSMPLSVAFPLTAGALIVGSQLTGWLWLRETMGLLHLFAIVLVLVGIVLLGMASRSAG